MRHHLKSLEQVASIGAWTEVIDAQAVAGIAVLRLVDRGGIYGAGSMLLVPVEDGATWSARRRAMDGAVRKLLAEVAAGIFVGRAINRHWRYQLPLVGWVRDLNRA